MMRRFAIYLILMLMFIAGLDAATVSGYVIEKKSGEPVIYAAVSIRGTNLGQYTNKKGYFIINSVPTGNIEVIATQIGFRYASEMVLIKNPQEEIFLKLELDKAAVQIEGIKVVEKELDDEINTRDIRVANVVQTNKDIKEVVSVAEADVFRSVLALPGVTPISDFSNGLYVRGGSADQNLILLDGIDVYNPSHFGGIFSTFNTDAVKNVQLLKGGFPAKYGGRLSSVLDVTNKDGNRKEHHGIGRVSLISSSLTLEGPWKIYDESGSYMASFRRTYLELVEELMDLDIPDYYFYDGHAKLNWDHSDRDKFSTSFYFGKDKLDFGFTFDMDIEWGNETWSNQWTHIFSPQWFSHMIIAGSHFYSKMKFEVEMGENTHRFDRLDDVYDVSLKEGLTWKPNEEHMVDMGLDYKYLYTLFDTDSNADVDENTMPHVDVSSSIASLYVQDSWKIGPLWTVQPGMRGTWCHNMSNYGNNPESIDYFRWAPRFSIRYQLGLTTNTYFSYGRYHQFLNLISTDESSPMDLWFPIDNTVEPGQSDHYIIGFKTEINEEIGFDIEAYYKDYKNLVAYRAEVDYEWQNDTGTLDDALNSGDGFSYGLDFMLRNDWYGIAGFTGYTLGFTRKKIEDTNLDPETGEPHYYYPKYDRTHQITVVETFSLLNATGKKLWNADLLFGTNYSFGTGQPMSKPEHVYIEPDTGQYQFFYSYKDGDRLPNYSRLDLSIKMRWETKHASIEPYFQVINVFNRQNVYTRTYVPESKEVESDGTGGLVEVGYTTEDTYQFPRIPFIGINVEW